MQTLKKVLSWIAIGFTLLWVLLFVVAFIAVLTYEPVKRDSILRVTLAGELAERETPRLAALLGAQEVMSLRALTESLRSAADDARIKGVVLQVNEPQVSVADLTEIEEAMAAFRTSGKLSLSYLESAGELSPGDAALALAASARQVVLAPSGEVNLAGLRVVVPFLKGTLDKLEIQPFVVKREAFKTAPNSLTEAGFTPAHRESLASLAGSLQSVVVDHLAARRNVKAEVIREWMRTGPHIASDALAKGMVDTLGYWDTVASAAESAAGRKDCFVSLATYARERKIHTHGPRVALIIGEGEIHSGKSSSPWGGRSDMGSETLVRAFRAARASGASGIVFRVNSPGGSYVASDAIRREVQLSREQKVPVVVSMGSYAASGGYLVTLGADRVIADPGSITGSIGVFAVTFATRLFWQHFLGVTFGEIDTAPDAVAPSFLDPPSAREQAAIHADVDRIYADFVGKVARARGRSPAEIEAVAQGRVWSGRGALAHGLIDELGSTELAVTRVKELAGIPKDSDVTLFELPQPEGFWQTLLAMLDAEDTAQSRLPRDARLLSRALVNAAHGLSRRLAELPGELEVRW